jgi:hypothetical protein
MIGELERIKKEGLQLSQEPYSRLPGKTEENYEKILTMAGFQASI